MARTTTDLLAAVRRAAFLPDASDQSDTDLLALADQELETLVSEAVVSGRGEHWWATEDTAIVPGTATYRLPRRLLGRAVRAVVVVSPTATDPELPLAQVDPVELRAAFPSTLTGTPALFAFEGDFVRLGPIPAASGWTLRVMYVRRPSKLVAVSTTAMAQIYAAPSTTNVRIIETAPSTDLTTALSVLDIVRGQEPYDVLFEDRKTSTSQAFSAPNFYFEASTPIVVADIQNLASPLKPGTSADWLVQRDQTPLPPVPQVLWTSLVYATAAATLAATRDPGTGAMSARAVAAKNQALAMMAPRDERQTQTIINPNSALRSFGRRRWR